MAQKRAGGKRVLGLTVTARRNGERHVRLGSRNGGARARLDTPSLEKTSNRLNSYTSAIELNQSRKYTVRVRAAFGRSGWVLRAFFLASSLDGAIKKLEQALQNLQRHEERLWFWGVERSDDPNLTDELLEKFGLRLDRRGEFPKKATSVTLIPEREVPASVLGPMRRGLAESVEFVRAAAAGD